MSWRAEKAILPVAGWYEKFSVEEKSESMLSPDDSFVVCREVQSHATPDGLLLLVCETGQCLKVNRTGAVLWPALKSGSSLEAAARLLETVGAPTETAMSDVVGFANALVKLGLLLKR